MNQICFSHTKYMSIYRFSCNYWYLLQTKVKLQIKISSSFYHSICCRFPAVWLEINYPLNLKCLILLLPKSFIHKENCKYVSLNVT